MMDVFSDLSRLEDALHAIGDLLAERDERYELCVIGGAAFLIQEPERSHATADIEVAAQLIDGRLVEPVPMPAPLQRAIDEVARTEDLPPHWINASVAASFGIIVPEGFVGRARRMDFGGLVLHVAGRSDLIKLKLLAVGNRRGAASDRHLDDLRRARPTRDEVQEAAEWVRSQRTDAAAFEDRLRATIERLTQVQP